MALDKVTWLDFPPNKSLKVPNTVYKRFCPQIQDKVILRPCPHPQVHTDIFRAQGSFPSDSASNTLLCDSLTPVWVAGCDVYIAYRETFSLYQENTYVTWADKECGPAQAVSQ